MLGIETQSSSLAELNKKVRKARIEIALKLHPDRCKVPGAAEALKKVNNAHNALMSDAREKQQQNEQKKKKPGPLLDYMLSYYASIYPTLLACVNGDDNLVIGPVIQPGQGGRPPSINTYCTHKVKDRIDKIIGNSIYNWDQYKICATVNPFDPDTALLEDVDCVKEQRAFVF